jgi:microcystin-dependent protein
MKTITMKKQITMLCIALLTLCSVNEVTAQQEGMLGEVKLFAGNFAPRNWALCEGQLLPIAQNQALFSILGTTYGGDGRTTFALPDLRGRVAIQQGQGPGLPDYRLGEKGGAHQNVLTINNMPSHNHGVKVNVNTSPGEEPTSTLVIANHSAAFVENATSGSVLGGVVENNVGASTPVNNMQPYLAVNYIICLQGTFPSRN